MAREASGVSKKVVEVVFLEDDLRRAREMMKYLEEVYGADARIMRPHLYSMVESVYVARGAEIFIAALIVGGLCAWATGVLK